MTRISGSGAEGNLNSTGLESTWAQPSGISLGQFNENDCYFIADSESSAVRVLMSSTFESVCIAGATDDVKDLMAFGDKPGVGFDAKLQHLMGVHYCDSNKTLYVADTYNHKIKTIRTDKLD